MDNPISRLCAICGAFLRSRALFVTQSGLSRRGESRARSITWAGLRRLKGRRCILIVQKSGAETLDALSARGWLEGLWPRIRRVVGRVRAQVPPASHRRTYHCI